VTNLITASPDPIFTNAHIYREIASESLQRSETLLEIHRRPREDDQPGMILSRESDRASFKHSLIAIVFAGMYFEAAFWRYGFRRLGEEGCRVVDPKELEKPPRALGIENEGLEAQLKAYREAKKELVHEKAVSISTDRSPIRVAQQEARKAVELTCRVESVLQ
jgi:hypothetical protein